jgi:hypothetical protein
VGDTHVRFHIGPDLLEPPSAMVGNTMPHGLVGMMQEMRYGFVGRPFEEMTISLLIGRQIQTLN